MPQSIIRKKPFKYNICGSTFRQKVKLNGHISLVHEGKKSFDCNSCEASFENKSNLEMHIASVHEEKTPDTFGNRFNQKFGLNYTHKVNKHLNGDAKFSKEVN